MPGPYDPQQHSAWSRMMGYLGMGKNPGATAAPPGAVPTPATGAPPPEAPPAAPPAPSLPDGAVNPPPGSPPRVPELPPQAGYENPATVASPRAQSGPDFALQPTRVGVAPVNGVPRAQGGNVTNFPAAAPGEYGTTIYESPKAPAAPMSLQQMMAATYAGTPQGLDPDDADGQAQHTRLMAGSRQAALQAFLGQQAQNQNNDLGVAQESRLSQAGDRQHGLDLSNSDLAMRKQALAEDQARYTQDSGSRTWEQFAAATLSDPNATDDTIADRMRNAAKFGIKRPGVAQPLNLPGVRGAGGGIGMAPTASPPPGIAPADRAGAAPIAPGSKAMPMAGDTVLDERPVTAFGQVEGELGGLRKKAGSVSDYLAQVYQKYPGLFDGNADSAGNARALMGHAAQDPRFGEAGVKGYLGRSGLRNVAERAAWANPFSEGYSSESELAAKFRNALGVKHTGIMAPAGTLEQYLNGGR